MHSLFRNLSQKFPQTPINVIARLYHRNQIRVRFAPSPTGYLHLGGLRTALYNYLYAKAYNGKFILRIEDTDRTRMVEGAQKQLITDLKWAGVQIDEGPDGIGGDFGPYVQSERVQIYRDEVKKLLENGSAYYCFCTERRLELLRKDAARTRQVPKYDNKCRHLTPIQIAEKLAKEMPFCIRFHLKSYTEPVKDLIYGDVSYDVSENEGDPVIIKSDGFPTYHFANVVDDHMMRISHVFRGVEWQISTTKHLLMYKAFGWIPPQYGHLPLLVNPDGTKLSKRQGDIHISNYRDRGIFPQALVNFVTAAGGGFSRDPSSKPKSYSIPELASQFDIHKVNSHPSRLNPDLLYDFNRLEIIRLVSNEKSCEKLVKEVKSLVLKTFPERKNKLELDSGHIKNILQWSANRLNTLHDLVQGNLAFLWIRPNDAVESDLSEDELMYIISELNCVAFAKENLQTALKEIANKKGIKFAKLMKIFRSALSGLKEGPGVAEMMEILGKETAIQRLTSNIKTKSK